MDVRQQIAYIIDTFEGGRAERLRPGASYSDDPDDHGLETRWGISRPLLSEFLGFNVRGGVLCSVEHVRDLTLDEAIVVGTEMIALRPGLFRIDDDRLRFVVLDFAFHSGPGHAISALQRALGFQEIAVDGIFGRHTEAAVHAVPDIDLACERVTAQRLSFIGVDLTHNRDQGKYAHGWMQRVGQVLCYREP